MLSYNIRSKATRKVTKTFVLQHRLRHQPPSRTIQVQLLADIQGLGRLGSIQNVAPGWMRSVLHPQQKAVYLLKNATPQLPSTVALGNGALCHSQDQVDFANMKSRLEALVPLVFRRPLSISPGRSLGPHSAKGQPIHGSVTLHDISQRLNETYKLSLVPPDAVLTLQEKNMRGQIRKTGRFIVLAHLRSGNTISLSVLVEPEVASAKQGQPPEDEMIMGEDPQVA